jgi:glucose/mannose-6-phosphate isomerase
MKKNKASSEMKQVSMVDLTYRLPEQIRTARMIAQATKIPRWSKPNNIVISGMGGSGIGGEILQSLLSYYSTIPVLIVKDYSLPKYVTKKSLFFAVSHSGNTEETISAYRQATAIGCPIICITSGGKLWQIAQGNKAIVIKIPSGLPPRTAIGYLFIPFLISLNRLGIIKNFDPDINETIKTLGKRKKTYQKNTKNLANELDKKVPFIYSTSRLLNPVANRWRCEFNELSKVLAHTNYFPELNHNEIVGLGGPEKLKSSTYLLILIDPAGHPRNKLRVDFTLKITKGSYFKVQKFLPDGKSHLARVFSLIMQGDLLSYYLAMKRKVDPLPVVRIDELKKRLSLTGKY